MVYNQSEAAVSRISVHGGQMTDTNHPLPSKIILSLHAIRILIFKSVYDYKNFQAISTFFMLSFTEFLKNK